MARADNKKASSHSFRHSTAFKIAHNYGLGSAMKQLQHQSISTTQKYYSLPYFTKTDYFDFS
jgi:integrase